MSRRILKWFAVGSLVAVALAGCSNNPKDAVQIDGKAYTVTEAEQAAQQFTELFGQPVTAEKLVPLLSYSKAALAVGNSLPQPLTVERIRKDLETLQEKGQIGKTTQPLTDTSVAVIASNQIFQMINHDPQLAQLFQQEIGKETIVVNPRFGKLAKDKEWRAARPINVIVPQNEVGGDGHDHEHDHEHEDGHDHDAQH